MACLLSALTLSAYDFYKDGIYYNKTSSTTVSVTGDFDIDNCNLIESTDYSGYVSIPPQVTYNGVTYTVDEIGTHAFKNSDISQLVIPATVGYIDYHAFEACHFSSIVCFPTDPSIMSTWGWGSDYQSGDAGTLYVPASVVDDFENSYRWDTYCGSIEAINGVAINSTNFPDANFRNYLLSLFPNGYLLPEDIEGMTSLSIYNKGIANMKGIEYFTELRELRCWGNSFTSLNLNNNTQLTYLDCAPNSQLTSLSVNSCSNLQTLICYSTGLTTLSINNKSSLTKLDCHNCTSLTRLICYSNNLTTLNVTGCTALENLQCYYNYNLSAITGLADCTAITYLDCEDCAITELPGVNNMTNIGTLWARYNKLTSLTVTNKSNLTNLRVKGNTTLTDLTCYSNALTSLDVTGCTALTTLKCYYNYSLASITGLADCTAITYLDCEDCAITELPGVNSMTNIATLWARNNKLTTLLVTNKSKLTNLRVSGNTLMTSLYCYNNALTTLSVSGCTAMTTLYCYGNSLTSIDVSSLTSLTNLSCNNNRLSSLNVSSNSALTTLKCNSNQLTSLDVSALSNLTKFNCSSNQLNSLNVNNNTKLQRLDCDDNNLTSLNVSSKTSLDTLYCRDNKLTSLNVQGCSALTRINCYNNKLTSLYVQGCNSLKSIQININQFTDAGMTTLVNSLPTRTSANPGTMAVRSENNSEEGNVFTRAHLTAANNKNWIARHFTSNGWEDIVASATGDVNGDGNVNIADVTDLIDILLNGTTPPMAADVDGDGHVNIADVTALIDLLLSGNTKSLRMMRPDVTDDTVTFTEATED